MSFQPTVAHSLVSPLIPRASQILRFAIHVPAHASLLPHATVADVVATTAGLAASWAMHVRDAADGGLNAHFVRPAPNLHLLSPEEVRNARLVPSGVFPTIMATEPKVGADSGRVLHPTLDRMCSPRESAAAQTFPPTYKFEAPSALGGAAGRATRRGVSGGLSGPEAAALVRRAAPTFFWSTILVYLT